MSRDAGSPPTSLILRYICHLVHHGSTHTHPTWHATVDEIWSAVHREGARSGRLSVNGACNQQPDGDTRRRDTNLDRFGPSDRRNTLRPVSLVYCIEYMLSDPSLRGTPTSPYILWRRRVTSKVSYLVLLQYLVQLVILPCTP